MQGAPPVRAALLGHTAILLVRTIEQTSLHSLNLMHPIFATRDQQRKHTQIFILYQTKGTTLREVYFQHLVAVMPLIFLIHPASLTGATLLEHVLNSIVVYKSNHYVP